MNVTFRFYGDLNDLLHKSRRQRDFRVRLQGRSSVKDAVESLGVPHVEAALLLVNGQVSGWERILGDLDRVAVYPEASGLPLEMVRYNNSELNPLGSVSARKPIRFILDVHLGRLAAYLRLLGLDTLYFKHDVLDHELVRMAVDQERILLSMDRKLLMFKQLRWGRIIRSKDPKSQVREVLDRFRCHEDIRPFTRCLLCNSVLERAGEITINELAPAKVMERFRGRYSVFGTCRTCKKLYWPGSHWEKMRGYLLSWGIEV